MKCRLWAVLFLVVLWISLCTAAQCSHNFHHNRTCCANTPPVDLRFAANNQTLFLVLLDSVTKQPFVLQYQFYIRNLPTCIISFWAWLADPGVDFWKRKGISTSRLGPTCPLMVTKGFSTSRLEPTCPLIVTNGFFPQGKSYNGLKLGAFLRLIRG